MERTWNWNKFNCISIALNSKGLYVGGSFITAGSITVNRIAEWTNTWSAVGSSSSPAIITSDILINGTIINPYKFSFKAESIQLLQNASTWTLLTSSLPQKV